MPDAFMPTPSEINFLRAIRFISSNRESIREIDEMPAMQKTLAETCVHLARTQGEEASILGGIITLAQIFPLECKDFRVNLCGAGIVHMQADFHPDLRINAVLQNTGKIGAKISLILTDDFEAEIMKEFFAGHTLADFIRQMNKPVKNRAKQLVISSLQKRLHEYSWERNYQRDPTEIEIAITEACIQRLKENPTLPIKSGYRLPEN